jgi:glycosyltransferase involved in cell wall biosynthesis
VMPGWVGLTCVHGFANGLPCITATERATAQTPEFAYIVDGYNGVILEDLESQLFADAILALADDDARLSSLRAGALETARRLDMDQMADVFVAALQYAADDT